MKTVGLSWGLAWEQYDLSDSRDLERWVTVERRIVGQLSTEPGRSFWHDLNSLYSPEFVSRVDHILAAREAEAGTQ